MLSDEDIQRLVDNLIRSQAPYLWVARRKGGWLRMKCSINAMVEATGVRRDVSIVDGQEMADLWILTKEGGIVSPRDVEIVPQTGAGRRLRDSFRRRDRHLRTGTYPRRFRSGAPNLNGRSYPSYEEPPALVNQPASITCFHSIEGVVGEPARAEVLPEGGHEGPRL